LTGIYQTEIHVEKKRNIRAKCHDV